MWFKKGSKKGQKKRPPYWEPLQIKRIILFSIFLFLRLRVECDIHSSAAISTSAHPLRISGITSSSSSVNSQLSISFCHSVLSKSSFKHYLPPEKPSQTQRMKRIKIIILCNLTLVFNFLIICHDNDFWFFILGINSLSFDFIKRLKFFAKCCSQQRHQQ